MSVSLGARLAAVTSIVAVSCVRSRMRGACGTRPVLFDDSNGAFDVARPERDAVRALLSPYASAVWGRCALLEHRLLSAACCGS